MSATLRRIVPVLGGLAAAMLIITLFEGLGGQLYPPPSNLDLTSHEVLRTYISQLPATALLLVLAGYGVAALIGGWLAIRLAKAPSLQPALIVAAILLGGSLMNLRAIPHPAWFWAANLLLVAVLPLAGARLAGRGMTGG